MREPEFEGNWSDKEKEIWLNTDWKARDYRELSVEDDTIESIGYFYSRNAGMRTKKLTFVKYIRSNPIFPPYYGPIYTTELKDFMKLGKYCFPCFDGRNEGKYQIHDRFDDSELADILSR